MTESDGIGFVQIRNEAITSVDFADYLKKLQQKYRTRRLAVFMDNLNVHKSKEVQLLYKQLNITPLWNVSYSPEYNPIEAVFSKVKAIFNQQRLNCLVNKIGFNIENTIKIAFKRISADHCAACVRKSTHLLERACENNI